MGTRLARWLRSDFAFVVGLALFASAVTAGPFLASGRLHHDTLAAYSFFYDNVHSLNRFGEPAWWSPHIRHGTPTYFYGLVGIPSLGKPAFVLTASIAWLLGKLGVSLPAIMPLYAIQFGVVVPFVFLVGVWLVARQVLRSRAAIRYVLVVAAFSPAVLVNLTDPGNLESTAYGLFCAAAFLRWLARPTAKRFAVLACAALLVSVSISHPALVTSVPMLAVLLAATAIAAPAARRALRAVPVPQLALAAALLAATALPSALAFVQQRDAITYSEVGALEYEYGNLKSGNPLQFLLVGLPGTIFDWDAYRQPADAQPSELRLRPLRWGEELGESYLGLLALPLAIAGFLYGRRRVRVPLLVMLVLAAGVVVLFPASPLLAPFLLASPALRTNNHYGDLLHAGGGFLILTFAAGLGFEAAERNPAVLRRLALVFAAVNAIGLAAYLRFAQPPAGLAGFAILMAFATAIALAWASRLPRRSRTHRLATGLLALALLDVATVTFWYTRYVLHGATPVTDSGLDVRMIGTRDGDARSIAELFVLKDTKALLDAGVAIESIPFLRGYCTAHAIEGTPAPQDVQRAVDASPARSLALPKEVAASPELAPFVGRDPAGRCEIAAQAAGGTYDAIRVRVRAEQPGIVLIRDAWAPQWRATANGKPVAVFRALGAFKAVAVPKGDTEIALRFAPPWIGASLAAAYAVLIGAAWVAWRNRG